jgi:KOW motif
MTEEETVHRLLALGVRRCGQRVRVISGRHAGTVGKISRINWTEAEVLVGRRWFAPSAFEVLDPMDGPMPKAVASKMFWDEATELLLAVCEDEVFTEEEKLSYAAELIWDGREPTRREWRKLVALFYDLGLDDPD